MGLLFFDIEADNLLYDVSTIWCITAFDEDAQNYLIYHVDTDEEIVYPKNSKIYINNIYKYISTILDTNKYITAGHNSIGYDLPVIKKLHGVHYDLNKTEDTHILSRLFYPDRDGHSLEDWGKRMGYYKGDHKDFTKFTNEMLQYNIRDVDLTRKVYYNLVSGEKDWDWSEAKKLEYHVWHLMMEQEQHGVLFDVEKAIGLSDKIQQEISEIEQRVLSEIPKKAVQVGAVVSKPFLKNGEYTKQVKEWIDGP